MPRIIKDASYGRSRPVQVGKGAPRGFAPTYLPGPAATEAELGQGNAEQDPVGAAKEEAQAILAEAEANAAALIRDAASRGYTEGKAEGFRAAQEQCQEYLERIAELARRAAIDRESMIRSAERELAALAMEVAAKVIKREVETDPSVVLSMVENALGKVGPGDTVRIVVHPEDAELVRGKWSELRGAVAFGPNWEIVGDERMERGGCIVETRDGLVDSRIETQLSEIASAFEVAP